jgi:hypothetical protein
MNAVLRPYKDYARYYIDNIVIFFKTFSDHIEYIDTIFQLFDDINITLKGLKAYIRHLSIVLLS